MKKELQKIYDSGINIHISTFWDGGWDLKLGDIMNGYKTESCVDSVDEIIPWFQEQIAIHYPNSEYMKTKQPTKAIDL